MHYKCALKVHLSSGCIQFLSKIEFSSNENSKYRFYESMVQFNKMIVICNQIFLPNIESPGSKVGKSKLSSIRNQDQVGRYKLLVQVQAGKIYGIKQETDQWQV